MISKSLVFLLLALLFFTESALGQSTIAQLRASISGEVIVAGDATYNDRRTGYNARYSRIPAVIVRPKNLQDVVTSLSYARNVNIKVTSRSGGNSASALSILDESLVIDTSLLKNVTVNPVSMTAEVESGVTSLELYTLLEPMGYSAIATNCPAVGVVGSTLGGGANDLSPKWGYALDNVVSLRAVLANGTIVTADEDTHSNLFWALRGGGHAGLASVYSITIKLYPLVTYYSAFITYPWSEAERVLVFMAEFEKTMPLGTNLYGTTVRSGTATSPTVQISCAYNGPLEEGRAICAPFLSIANPISVSDGPTTIRSATLYGPNPRFGSRRAITKGYFLKSLDRSTIRMLVRQTELSPKHAGANARVNFYFHGGAMLDADRTSTSFVHRSKPWNIVLLATYVPEALTPSYDRWVNTIYTRLRSSSYNREVYQNYADDTLINWQWSYYGENYPRLCSIKREYDPINLFSGPQTIPV